MRLALRGRVAAPQTAATRLKDELDPTFRPLPRPPHGSKRSPERNPGAFKMSSLLAADPALLFWSLAVVHIAGLVSMLLARLPRSHRVHALCHHSFFACLLFVGAVTMLTILTRSN